MGIYTDNAVETLKKVMTQTDEIAEASEYIKQTIKNDGLIYIFGCGHSHILSEEMFYRAGGLANIYPILYEPIMLHEGAASSSTYERQNDYIDKFINKYEFDPNDTLIAISTSGINPVTTDVAKYAKSKDMKVISITSLDYTNSQESRHDEGLKLKDVGDVIIDNMSPIGDASLQLKNINQRFAPTSTFVGTAILHEIVSTAIFALDDERMDLPIFKSGNLENSDEHNKKLIEKYSKRIPILK